jgi:hypothetical protein
VDHVGKGRKLPVPITVHITQYHTMAATGGQKSPKNIPFRSAVKIDGKTKHCFHHQNPAVIWTTVVLWTILGTTC